MNQPKKWVVAIALTGILLLAVVVCALHWFNAVSLRGTVAMSAYEMMNTEELENKKLVVNEPHIDGNILHIEGALMRLNQAVGKVNVRVSLIHAQDDGQFNPAQQMILLNTQLVRRQDLAAEYGCDDHCGFHAAVDIGYLNKLGNKAYRVALADTTDKNKQLILTDITVLLSGNEVKVNRTLVTDEGAYHAE